MSMLNEARRGELVDTRDRSFKGKMKSLFPWKGDDLGEIMRKLIYLCAVCVLVYSLVDAYNFQFGTSDMHDDKDSLTNLYNQGATTPDKPVDNNPSVVVPDNNNDNANGNQQGDVDAPAADVPDSPYPAGMLKNFEALYDMNSDIIGWVSIKDFGDENGNYIDYPVMQSEDNDYYLSHDFFRNEKSYGAIYADARSKITATRNPDVTILYGHNMASGGFFTKLHEYKNKASFVKDNNIVTYSTLWEENEYVIFACFLTGVREDQDDIPIFKYHNILQFKNNLAQFDYWYKNILYRNYYLTDIECTMDDEYLLLSTCSSDLYDARLVVVARKVREGEDPSKYTYVSNANVRMPAVFYETYTNAARPKNDTGPKYEYYDPENPDAFYVPKADITDEEIRALVAAQFECSDLIKVSNASVEKDMTQTDETGNYFKVTDQRFDEWNEWQSYVISIFDNDVAGQIVNSGVFIPVDGQTYCKIIDNPKNTSDDFEYTVSLNTENKVVVTVKRDITSEGEDTYSILNLVLKKTDAGWRIGE